MFRKDKGNKDVTFFEAIGIITFLIVSFYAGAFVLTMYFKLLLWIDSLF